MTVLTIMKGIIVMGAVNVIMMLDEGAKKLWYDEGGGGNDVYGDEGGDYNHNDAKGDSCDDIDLESDDK